MNCFAILLAAATSFNCFPPEIHTVGVVMPASIQPKARFDAGVESLKAAGFRIKLAKRLNFKTQASAADRAADFEEMWMDPEVDLVLCARGGSGSEDILPLLDWNRLRTRDQRVLGFSNITMILNAMAKEKAGHPFSGSTMSHLLYAKGDTFEWLKRAIAGSPQPAVKLRALRPGAFSGLPCGGHIALVRLGIKTNWACDAAGRVVFLERNNSASAKKIAEELDEIAASGWMKDCAGVIFGDVTPGREGKGGKRTLTGAELAAAQEEVARAKRAFVEKIGKPAYDGFAYGHIPVSHAIDFRRKVSVAEDGTMTWE
ncbi:MAG: LD-carboxypeptidase [Kiritimatiellae bacterium]|nr:LD-carboxypeptidase [Kiritimatiellia bacterium]